MRKLVKKLAYSSQGLVMMFLLGPVIWKKIFEFTDKLING